MFIKNIKFKINKGLNLMKFIKILFLILLCAFLVFSQDKSEKIDLSEKAIVYVYATTATATLGRVRPTVYFNGVKLAQIRPEHYFIAIIEPGEQTFHFKSKKLGGIKMEFESSNIYYLKVDFGDGALVKPKGIEEVSEKSAKFVIKNLKTVSKTNIKNPKLAFLELPK
jgi:hypothetical protein